MPLYEYQCDACGHRFETIQKFSDEPIGICPKCGGAVHKLQSAPAFHLKGSGWYITDYARKEQGAGAAKDNDKPSADQSAKSEKSEKSHESDKSQKSEKTDKAEKSDAPAKSGGESAAPPAKSDGASAPPPASSGSGSSTPTK
jgi:putative FmdB family regulatory protein